MKICKRCIAWALALMLLTGNLPWSAAATGMVASAQIQTPAVAAVTASGTCGDNLTWSLDDAGTLTISGTGAMYDYVWYYSRPAPWYDMCWDIKKVVVMDGVTYIGTGAFAECNKMTQIDIADSVVAVGKEAFDGCDDLQYNIYKDGCYVGNAQNPYLVLTCVEEEYGSELTVHKNTKAIVESAFSKCYSLEAIWVEAGNTYFCSDDRGVLFNKDKTVLIAAPSQISGSYKVPEGVQTIAAYAFYSCDQLVDLSIPLSVKTIGDWAFRNAEGLWYVYYDGTEADSEKIDVGTGNDWLFDGVEWHYTYTLEEPVSGTIGDNLTWTLGTDGTLTVSGTGAMEMDEFAPWNEYVSLVKKAVVEQGVTSIDYAAFESCVNLEEVAVAASVTKIGAWAFAGCRSLPGVVIPDGVTTIGESAFNGCTAMTDIKLPAALTVINENVFKDCAGLKSVEIPAAVKKIVKFAFSGCTSLCAVVIPASVTEIGGRAFENCTSLETVYYGGMKSQWSAITIYQDNDALTDADNFYYNYEPVTLQIDSVTLRGNDTGLYYSGSFQVKKGVKVARKGIVISLYTELPVADGTDSESHWTEGNTSVLVRNILKDGESSNADRATTPIYARAYVQLEDGTYIYGDAVSMNMRQVVEKADSQWTTLDDTQKTEIAGMYAKFQPVMDGWSIPNLKQS